MKRIAALYILLLGVVALSAQNIRMKVTLKQGEPYIVPADNVENISFEVVPLEDTYPNLKAIDLGLSVKWASINYEALNPEDKTPVYPWSNYSTNDIVFNNWTVPYEGNEWRMPTQEELDELVNPDNCDWVLNSEGTAFKVSKKGTTEPYILLPILNYWSSTSPAPGFSAALQVQSTGPTVALLSQASKLGIRPVWGLPAVTTSVTANVTNTTYNSATVNIEVVCSDPDKATAYGIEGTGVNKEISNKPSTSNTITLTSLNAGATYSFRAYVVVNNKKVYSSEGTITTPAKQLNLTAVSVSDIAFNAATLSMTITGDALGEVNYGVYYATSEDDLTDAEKRKEAKGTAALTGSAVTIGLTELAAETTYYYQVYAQRSNETPKTETGNFTTVKEVDPNAPQAVNLGLSVQWADRNIGAKKPSEYGGYYGFGDADGTETRTNGGYYATGKNFTSIGGDENYDIATKQLGEHWRLPTCKEIEELSKCKIAWDTEDGVNGWRVTSNNGNSIFIPCAGTWTKTQDENGNEIYNQRKERAYIWSDSAYTSSDAIYYRIETTPASGILNRYMGLSIRPVYDDGTGKKPVVVDPTKDLTNEIAEGSDPDGEGGLIPQAGIDMGTPGIKWARWNVGVKNKTGELGHYYSWGEKAQKETYSDATYTVNFKNMMSRELNHVLPDTADVAKQLWGGKWRMPKSSEIYALIEACNFEWTTDGGLEGYKLTSKTTGNTLFLPAGGYKRDNTTYVEGTRGCYWTSSGYNSGNDEKKRIYAAYLNFTSSGVPTGTDAVERYYGMLIRPVIDD